MRRRETPLPPSPVPGELRRFVAAEWIEPGPGDWVDRWVRAHRRWGDARREWAIRHGFDRSARFGERPGHDWWAFLALCKQGPS